VELTVSELLDPEAAAVLAADAPRLAAPPSTVVTARRDEAVVGVACGHRAGDELILDHVAVVPDARRQGIAHHLLGRFAALQRDSR
jgi:N-acetylglutamate synthase-like GNAT family acetyltransferase